MCSVGVVGFCVCQVDAVGGGGSVCAQLVRWGVSVCSVGVMEVSVWSAGVVGYQCVVSWCGGGSVVDSWLVSVCTVGVGGHCVLRWRDGGSVCGQLVWCGVSVCSVDVVVGVFVCGGCVDSVMGGQCVHS